MKNLTAMLLRLLILACALIVGGCDLAKPQNKKPDKPIVVQKITPQQTEVPKPTSVTMPVVVAELSTPQTPQSVAVSAEPVPKNQPNIDDKVAKLFADLLQTREMMSK
jgi:PBP1b-binding outer membrane lipoprotein LpoB